MEAIEIDNKNSNHKWRQAMQLELDQIDEYEVLKDLGVKPEIPEG